MVAGAPRSAIWRRLIEQIDSCLARVKEYTLVTLPGEKEYGNDD